MKKIICASIFILTFCVIIFAQNNQTTPCPTIEIFGPWSVPQPGNTITLTANIERNELKNLSYNWKVTTGEIIKGQGTSVIEVQLPKEWSGSFGAKVEVKGFPESCPNIEEYWLPPISAPIQTKSIKNSSDCPKIEVSGPTGVTMPGENLIFTANVQNYDSAKLIYNWTVSEGNILEGQGKPVIIVSTKKNKDINTTATVEIKGLPEGCKNTSSETASVACDCFLPITIGRYARIPFREEKAWLENVVFELNDNPDSVALFIITFTEKDSISSIKTRVKNITDFLSQTRQIPKDRFIFVFAEQISYQTTIYLLPPEAVNSFPDFETTLEEIEAQRKNRQK